MAREYPDCLVQTHLAENHAEIAFTRELYPNALDYTDVYAGYGLLGPKSLFGHCIHLSEREAGAMSESGSVAVFCPTSNLFLGSGLFDMARLRAANVRVAVATDIGGGTSYSMLTTMAEAYKVQMLSGYKPSVFDLYRMASRGNAERLHICHQAAGVEACFKVGNQCRDRQFSTATAEDFPGALIEFDHPFRIQKDMAILRGFPLQAEPRSDAGPAVRLQFGGRRHAWIP